jgi:hypothetical protein
MLTWTKFDPEGSIYSRGKTEYYVILVRGIPEERPKNGIIELFTTAKKMTISEIKYKPKIGEAKLLSRLVVGNLPLKISIVEAVEKMKEAAESRENKNSFGSLNSAYTTR